MLKGSIIGFLGADAQVVRGNTKDFVSLSVAHTRKFRNSKGVPIEETIWVHVNINWDCSNLLQYLVKGTKVYATGNLRLRSFQNREGAWTCGADIMADTLELCSAPVVDTTTNNNPNSVANDSQPCDIRS